MPKAKRKRKERKLKQSPKQKLVLRSKTPDEKRPEELEDFIREADAVQVMTRTGGWAILERDLTAFRDVIISKIVYTNPKRPEFDEAKALYIGIDKILSLVKDYDTNKVKAIEMLEKLGNPGISVAMDVDTE